MIPGQPTIVVQDDFMFSSKPQLRSPNTAVDTIILLPLDLLV
jgi:hypothetical protein